MTDQHLVRCFFGPCCQDTRFYERFLVILMNAKLQLNKAQQSKLLELRKDVNILAHQDNADAKELQHLLNYEDEDNNTVPSVLNHIYELVGKLDLDTDIINVMQSAPVVIDNCADNWQWHNEYGFDIIPDSELPF